MAVGWRYEALRLYAKGASGSEIGKIFSVTASRVYQEVRRAARECRFVASDLSGKPVTDFPGWDCSAVRSNALWFLSYVDVVERRHVD